MSHAKKSPSGADKWAVCTASPAMEEGLTDPGTSYSIEGDKAHDLLERNVKCQTDPREEEPDHPAALDVKVVTDYIKKFQKNPERYVVLSEQRVKLTGDIWGTADIIIIDLKALTLEIVDYKHGIGNIVEPDSRQNAIYLKASTLEFDWIRSGPLKGLKSTIIQPRAPHSDGPIRSKDYTIEELDDVIYPIIEAAARIDSGVTEFHPDDKTCKWCLAKTDCTAYAEAALDGIGAYFSAVDGEPDNLIVPTKDEIKGLTKDQKFAIYHSRVLLKSLLDTVAADIHNHLEINGPGYGLKLVRGKSNRKFKGTDEEVIEFLKIDLKLKPHQYTKSTLLGPKPIEDILKALKRGGKQKLELFAEKVEKPKGKATVVSEGDKRPALQPLFQSQETDPLA